MPPLSTDASVPYAFGLLLRSDPREASWMRKLTTPRGTISTSPAVPQLPAPLLPRETFTQVG